MSIHVCLVHLCSCDVDQSFAVQCQRLQGFIIAEQEVSWKEGGGQAPFLPIGTQGNSKVPELPLSGPLGSDPCILALPPVPCWAAVTAQGVVLVHGAGRVMGLGTELMGQDMDLKNLHGCSCRFGSWNLEWDPSCPLLAKREAVEKLT
jgi:hypothetical protein